MYELPLSFLNVLDTGAILAGNSESRTHLEQISFYKVNTGQAIADVALGAKVLENVNVKRLRTTLHC